MKKVIYGLFAVALFAFAPTTNAQASYENRAEPTIVEIAVSNDDFSTLVAALKAAGLVDALSGDGPFTVFAPNNAAFAKIDSKTLNSLLEPKNKETLTSILTYHVVPGNLMASDVVKALEKGNGKAEVTTLNGQKLTVVKNSKGIWLKDQAGNYSQITATDIKGSNGVIHVIGSVVMPK